MSGPEASSTSVKHLTSSVLFAVHISLNLPVFLRLVSQKEIILANKSYITALISQTIFCTWILIQKSVDPYDLNFNLLMCTWVFISICQGITCVIVFLQFDRASAFSGRIAKLRKTILKLIVIILISLEFSCDIILIVIWATHTPTNTNWSLYNNYAAQLHKSSTIGIGIVKIIIEIWFFYGLIKSIKKYTVFESRKISHILIMHILEYLYVTFEIIEEIIFANSGNTELIIFVYITNIGVSITLYNIASFGINLRESMTLGKKRVTSEKIYTSMVE